MDLSTILSEFKKRKGTDKGKKDITEMMSRSWTIDDLMKLAKDNGITATPEEAQNFLSQLNKEKL